MTIKSSQELWDFYVDWLAWAEGRASDVNYNPCWGLCSNAGDYLLSEMEEQFAAAGLDIEYPFGKDNYLIDRDVGEMRSRTTRLEWVRDRIADGVVG